MFEFLLEQAPNFILTLLGLSIVRSLIRSRWPKISETHLDISLGILLVFSLVVSGVNSNQKSQEAARQQQIIDAMREYSVVARLNPYGLTGKVGAGLKETPDARLADLKETWIEEGNNRTTKCDDPSIAKSRAVTVSYPQFPWSYFHLADCLRTRGDQAWKGYAEKAIHIFEYTTSIADHHSIHDKGLKTLCEFLAIP